MGDDRRACALRHRAHRRVLPVRPAAVVSARNLSGRRAFPSALKRRMLVRSAVRLLNEPDRHRVTIEFSVATLDGGDDDEDGVQDQKDGEENEADLVYKQKTAYEIVDEHRDLEVHGFF